MKKGIAQYPMFVYGLIILIGTLLLAIILFAVRPDFSFDDEKLEFSNRDITLMNYLRTPVTIEGLNFLMSDLIAYSYHNDDFELLEEETKKVFLLVYKDKCFWDVSYYVEGEKVGYISNIDEADTNRKVSDFDFTDAVIPALDNIEIKVELREAC